MKIQTRHKNVFVSILLEFGLILSWLVLLDKNQTEGLRAGDRLHQPRALHRQVSRPPVGLLQVSSLSENWEKSEWNIWEAHWAVTKSVARGGWNSLNHARLVLIIHTPNKTSSLVIFTIILMNSSNMQIIKTSPAGAEHHKTQLDKFFSSHLTVIVIPAACEGEGTRGVLVMLTWLGLTAEMMNVSHQELSIQEVSSPCHLWFSDPRIKPSDCHHQPHQQTLILSLASPHTQPDTQSPLLWKTCKVDGGRDFPECYTVTLWWFLN